RAGQTATGAGTGVAAGTAGAGGAGAAGAAGAGAAPYGYGQFGNQPNSGAYPTSGSAGFQSGPGGPGGPGSPGGPGPYGGQAPPRREKRGPGWGATIAIALIAALLGGALAFGGSYALSAFGGDEPRKVADQTIETPDWTQVAKQTSQSVVSIQVGTDGQVQALGSGSLYDDKGHVITNNHVVAPADTPSGEIAVTMKSGETTKAEIVGRDPSTDIAVIKLDQVPDDVDPLPVGDSKKMKVGDPVMALGNPLGLADSVTTGIVSALDRPVSTENIGKDATSQQKEMTITNAIQTDAAINPGNSGGPLVDGDGKFIGVNSAAASLSQAGEGGQSGSIGIGFAIPSSQAVMIADQLIASGKALHPFLGITLTDGQINSGGITRGSAKVQSVQSGSPADKAGFKDGDDIVSVAGTKVNNAIALRALVRAQPTNSPVDFTVVRGGQDQTLKATLVLK
ncbi:MAG: trypsin-like peptidase domain-containing protein, partial [Brevibacterium sp.]|nr:trypsin-like peptidase domain-containing protein [Brevibacterium sp.]